MLSRFETLAAIIPFLVLLSPSTASQGHKKNQVQTVDSHGDPLPVGAVARLGTTRFHQPWAWCVVFSRDGKVLVSGGRDGRIHVWNPRSGKELRSFKAQGQYITCLAFSPDGKLLATGAYQSHDVRIWDFASGKKVASLEGHTHSVDCVAFSPDGKTLASGCMGHSIRVWDIATSKQTHCFGDPYPPRHYAHYVHAVAFSPDGKYLAAGSTKKMVYLWDTSTWKPAPSLIGHTDRICALAFLPDSKRLISGGFDNTVRLWDIPTGKEIRRYGAEDDLIRSLALAPDGKTVAAGTVKGTVHLWETETAKELWQSKEASCILSLVFSPGGQSLAAVNRYRIMLWQADSGKPLQATQEPTSGVSLMAYSPDGKKLAVAYGDNEVRLWDTKKRQGLSRGQAGDIQQGRIVSLWLGPKDRMLAVTIDPANLRLWEVGRKKELGRLPQGWWGAAIAQEGAAVIIPIPEGLALWDPARGDILRKFIDKHPPRSFALSANGKFLASGGNGISIWDLRFATPLSRFGEEKGRTGYVAFSPEGRTVLSQYENSFPNRLFLWEAATGKVRLFLQGQIHVTTNAFSPDGRFLAVPGDFEVGIRVWDLMNGKLVLRLAGHRDRVTALAFSPDGKTLASGGEDTTVLFWDMSSLVPSQKPLADLPAKRLEELWQDLAGEDAEKAYQAIWILASHPGQVEPFLKRKLEKGSPTELSRIRRLTAELDSPVFAKREMAMRELEKLGRLAETELRESLKRGPSLEATRRLEHLLGKLKRDQLSPEVIQTIRALEVLERTGTPKARQLLNALGH